MDNVNLKVILDSVSRARIAVIGDFCLDSYWFIDPTAAETSVETGLATRPVRAQRYTLGGAGNVVMNLLAMNVREVHAFGVIGDDPFGREMLRLLTAGLPASLSADLSAIALATAEASAKEEALTTAGLVSVDGMLIQKDNWNTHVYTKPYLGDQEQNRIDFGNFNRLDQAVAKRLVELLEERLAHVDLIIINEQVAGSIHSSEYFRRQLAQLIARHPDSLFLLDSRNYSDTYAGAVRKLNAHEAVRLCGTPRAADELVMSLGPRGVCDAREPGLPGDGCPRLARSAGTADPRPDRFRRRRRQHARRHRRGAGRAI
ncbi:MAG: hypothetical protein HYV35_09705 [Lentisphaerae bacterium]|nr:hypothetical protein [Lentisphaerota bacterium]